MDAPDELPDSVIADLKNIQYLAIRHCMWEPYLRRGERSSAGVLLRRQFIHWFSLKQVILVQGDKEDQDRLFTLTPGHITLNDTAPRYYEDTEVVREGFLKRFRDCSSHMIYMRT